MKFFLLELYVQLNSPDATLSDQAEEKPENAGKRYDQHLARIKSQLISSIVEFLETVNFHDAEVFTPARLTKPMGDWDSGDMILVTQQIRTLDPQISHTLAFLHYQGCENVQIESPCVSEVFDPVQPIWLYDEWDLDNHFVVGNFSILLETLKVCGSC